ncbi:MAG: DUF2752 domain-containing protein [Planctomycetes bacterium]|nr:DUF2752 domain-containing protein [Planctomycetota bacterium]
MSDIHTAATPGDTLRPPHPAPAAASDRGERVSWWPQASLADRLVQVVLAGCCWAVLGLSLYVEPSPDGLGTHEQLGLAPCGFHKMTGQPCPGCGLTTAFAHMARGQVLEGVIVQPFGAVLFVLAAAGAVGLTITGILGRTWNLVLLRINAPVWLYALVFLALASWVYKIVYGQVTGGYGP